jgi:hypothetical protein
MLLRLQVKILPADDNDDEDNDESDTESNNDGDPNTLSTVHTFNLPNKSSLNKYSNLSVMCLVPSNLF